MSRLDPNLLVCTTPNAAERKAIAAKIAAAQGRRCEKCQKPLTVHNPHDLCFDCQQKEMKARVGAGRLKGLSAAQAGGGRKRGPPKKNGASLL